MKTYLVTNGTLMRVVRKDWCGWYHGLPVVVDRRRNHERSVAKALGASYIVRVKEKRGTN